MRRPADPELVFFFCLVLAVGIAFRAAAADVPAWRGWFRVSDGRTFVTDGALMIEAAAVRVDPLPEKKLELSAKIVDGYLAARGPEDVRVSELEPADDGKSYRPPSGVPVSARYVDYLRSVLPASTLRFRFDGDGKPIAIVSEGKTVGVVMPMARSRP